jgi:anti-sigma regulatory factor (Ser/Thr protein kinase)
MTDAVISVTIPCDARFVSLARLTATSLGAEVDLDVDALEDLRMAANELVAVVIEWGAEHAHETVTLTYRLHAQGLELTATADGASPDADNIEIDPLSRRILASVADSYRLGPGGGTLDKRRAAP